MNKSFWDGMLGLGKNVPRLPTEEMSYRMGERLSFRRPIWPGEPPFSESAPFFKLSLFCGALGALGGFGYGVWRVVTDHWSPGFGPDAVTALKWMGLGAGGGALLPAAVIVAAALGVIWLILSGLGLLLNLVAS